MHAQILYMIQWRAGAEDEWSPLLRNGKLVLHTLDVGAQVDAGELESSGVEARVVPVSAVMESR